MAIGLQSSMSTLLQVVEACGIIAFACSGFVEARRKDMDLVGVFIVAFVTAFGGGTLRDMLLDRRPLFWVEHQEYAILVFVLALLAGPFLPHLRSAVAEKTIVVADALGLGLFSAVGTSLALEAQMPVFICVMMGVTTGIFGGVLRDVLCNEIPMVFRREQLYATCSLLGCAVYMLLEWLDMTSAVALIASILVTSVLRLLAVRMNWRLPG